MFGEKKRERKVLQGTKIQSPRCFRKQHVSEQEAKDKGLKSNQGFFRRPRVCLGLTLSKVHVLSRSRTMGTSNVGPAGRLKGPTREDMSQRDRNFRGRAK